MEYTNRISEALQEGDLSEVTTLAKSALEEGTTAQDILDALLSGMSIIGEKFKNNEVFVPEVLVAARAMNMGVSVLKPLLVESGVQSTGKVCIGTVQGDLHDIGKNLVAMMIESAGFEIVDLEVDVSLERFVEAIQTHSNVKIVALSTLLTTTMPAMKRIVEGLNQLENRDSFRIMVGGAPITEEFARQIGADGYSPDAAAAAVLAKSLAS